MPYPLDGPASSNSPTYQALVAAHERYLKQLHALVQVDLRGKAIGHWLPYAFYVHILQLGRAVQTLVTAGYPDEALPLTRAMLSAMMNLLFVVTSENANGWALRYWLQLGEMEQRFLVRELKRVRFDAAIVRDLIEQARGNVAGAIAQAEAEGIRLPEKLATPEQGRPRRDTWTGLSDRALAKQIGQLEAYETEYDYASAITHVQAVALKPIADALLGGRPLGSGPYFGPPLPAIGASYNASSAALLGIVKHFELDNMRAVDSATQEMRDAIDLWREVSGANDQIKLIFGDPTSLT